MWVLNKQELLEVLCQRIADKSAFVRKEVLQVRPRPCCAVRWHLAPDAPGAIVLACCSCAGALWTGAAFVAARCFQGAIKCTAAAHCIPGASLHQQSQPFELCSWVCVLGADVADAGG